MTVTGILSALFTGSISGAPARLVPPSRPVAAAAHGRRSLHR